MKLLVVDVSHYCVSEENGTPAFVGQLLPTLCGTREPGHEWDGFANKKIAAVGYQIGLSSPCIYVHNTEPSIGWRHGDDILLAGEGKFVDEVSEKSKGEMIRMKRVKLGFAENDDKHCTILNRLIDFTMRESGPIILYEPGPRHVELLLEHLELDGTKSQRREHTKREVWNVPR